MLVVRLKGVADRNAAEKLNGLELSVPQEKLPPAEEGEYYHADLIGLSAVTLSGTILGTVVGVPNYGAGDLLEIARLAATRYWCRSPTPRCLRSTSPAGALCSIRARHLRR